jgi:transcriptional regulator with XRE-family HTH domain
VRVKLRSVRERLFVTQEELAERTGMSRATISRIESGQQRPRISTVRKLAAALGVAPETLVDWEGEESPDMGKAAA